MNFKVMNNRNSDDLNEIKLFILELSQQFNRKFVDQSRIIRQQRDRLEFQQEQLNNQRAIIEELAWQIRDLRDSVRNCSEKISNTHTEYPANCPEKQLKVHIPIANNAQQSYHRTDSSPIYESINFDASLVTAKIKNIQVHDGIENSDQIQKPNLQNRNDVCGIHDYPDRCIPPPLVVPPPHDIDSDSDQYPVQISDHTLEKLNSLYSLYKVTSVDDKYDELDDVVLRLRKNLGESNQ